jgi:CP family cyanate transporter-like MFS transporter
MAGLVRQTLVLALCERLPLFQLAEQRVERAAEVVQFGDFCLGHPAVERAFPLHVAGHVPQGASRPPSTRSHNISWSPRTSPITASGMTDKRPNILIPWLAGVVAAQLAKSTVLAPWLRAKFWLSLTEVGFLISLLEVGGAVFGFIAGLALSVISLRRLLVVGLALLAATLSVEAFANGAALMFAARTAAGIAYLLIVIGAPTLMVGLTNVGRERDRAMVLWSTLVPVGIGLGSVITGISTKTLGARGAILCWAAAAVIMLIAVLGLPSPPATRRSLLLPSRGARLLSAGFGCYPCRCTTGP